jgi:hypothetical protein
MAPTMAGMMGLVPVHAFGVELGVLFAQMLIQLRLRAEPQIALRALKRAHGLMVLLLASASQADAPVDNENLKDP